MSNNKTKIIKRQIREAGYKHSVILKDGKANMIKLERIDGNGGVILFKSLFELEEWLKTRGIDEQAIKAQQNYRKSDYIQYI